MKRWSSSINTWTKSWYVLIHSCRTSSECSWRMSRKRSLEQRDNSNHLFKQWVQWTSCQRNRQRKLEHFMRYRNRWQTSLINWRKLPNSLQDSSKRTYQESYSINKLYQRKAQRKIVMMKPTPKRWQNAKSVIAKSSSKTARSWWPSKKRLGK